MQHFMEGAGFWDVTDRFVIALVLGSMSSPSRRAQDILAQALLRPYGVQTRIPSSQATS